jgi:hypothetical protein
MSTWKGEELISGALSGKDAEEQEYEALRHSGGALPPRRAAEIAEAILAEDAPSSTTPKPARVSGVPQGYGDPRVS